VDVQVFGQVERTKQVNALFLGDYIYVARANGTIDQMDLDGNVKETFSVFEHQLDQKNNPILNKHRKPEHFIGLCQRDGLLISMTDKGLLSVIHLDNGLEKHDIPERKTHVGQELLCAMKVNPELPHLIATGGDERDLCVWDLNSDLKEQMKPHWQAKNVKNDFLDMRVPIWITVIEWTGKDTLYTGTGYHQIRSYDMKQRRPLHSFEIGEHPIKALAVREKDVVCSDTTGQVWSVDKTGKLLGSYRGIAGAVTQLQVSEKLKQLVTVGADRYCRVFELEGQRRLVTSTYLKQRLTALVIAELEEQEEEDEWEAMETVTDSKKRQLSE
ncbi:WD40-repeat-containing domain protein, partial [Gorgonomyces haynaldii]